MNMAWSQELTVAEAMQSAGKIMQEMIDEYYANKS